jgi:GAF domain
MEHPSVVDQSLSQNSSRSSASPAVGVIGPAPANPSSTPSVSAGIAAVTAHPPRSSETRPRFPGEEGGHSLAEMARSDLDAALQLLAERAQYITGATGAAIALRRGEHNDMLCRASAGSNAPELGALLSMEYGLSGESVRKRQAMRCDDAERDPRVNREGCRHLGIASVVVMPIVSDDQALGVFELFSGKPHAFDQRDLTALQRLSHITEIAVKHAVAAQTTFARRSPAADFHASTDVATVEIERTEPAVIEPVINENEPLANVPHLAPEAPVSVLLPQKTQGTTREQRVKLQEKRDQEAKGSNKPLFWSAAIQKQASSRPVDEAAKSIAVPPVLRNLQKCQACGFPVSQGRTLCVECEEKHWRGQTVAQPTPGRPAQAVSALISSSPLPGTEKSAEAELAAAAAAGVGGMRNLTSPTINSAAISEHPLPGSSSLSGNLPPQNVAEEVSVNVPVSESATLFVNSAADSRSWLAQHKYILAALLVVAIVIAAVAWLR